MFSRVGRGLYESALDMLMWTTAKGVLFLHMNTCGILSAMKLEGNFLCNKSHSTRLSETF